GSTGISPRLPRPRGVAGIVTAWIAADIERPKERSAQNRGDDRFPDAFRQRGVLSGSLVEDRILSNHRTNIRKPRLHCRLRNGAGGVGTEPALVGNVLCTAGSGIPQDLLTEGTAACLSKFTPQS